LKAKIKSGLDLKPMSLSSGLIKITHKSVTGISEVKTTAKRIVNLRTISLYILTAIDALSLMPGLLSMEQFKCGLRVVTRKHTSSVKVLETH
jgi:hypothetical protein